jgi:hypothetical protein
MTPYTLLILNKMAQHKPLGEITNITNSTKGILNSLPCKWYIKQTNPNPKTKTKKFLKTIPIPILTEEQTTKITEIVEIVLYLSQLTTTQTRDNLALGYWEQLLNGLVYELYFPEELHEANLYLFNLVPQLPNPTQIQEPLPLLRQLFETNYKGTHPIRIALEKLQTFDIVRIIENHT